MELRDGGIFALAVIDRPAKNARRFSRGYVMDDDWTSQDTIWLLKAVSFGGGILVAIGGGILIYARYIL